MPTGREIVKELLKFVHTHYALTIPDFNDSIDNDLLSTDQAISDLKLEGTIPLVIKHLLDCLQEINLSPQFMIDQFTVGTRIEIVDFNTGDYRKRNRPFSISDIQFGYLSSKYLLKPNPISTIVSDSEGYRTLIDFLGSAIILPELNLLRDFISILETNDTSKGLLVHKFAHAHPSPAIYSYLFFQKLIQGGKIDIDQTLFYTRNHGAVVTLNNVVYQQYFELFDIINEVNHSTEIITRFLKVYHMLEYLVYRVELVKVEEKARLNRTFIREIHGLAGKGSAEKEFEIFKKNFPKIFNAEIVDGYFNLGVLSPDQVTFLKNKIGLDPYTPTDKEKVCRLIYILRNSIVHNKESEFHMTTTNPDEYIDMIPLLNILIEKLERLIIDKIAADVPSISYQNRVIELY
jgi:hypothetical protein